MQDIVSSYGVEEMYDVVLCKVLWVWVRVSDDLQVFILQEFRCVIMGGTVQTGGV